MKVGVDAAVVPVDDIQQVLEVGRLYSLQIAEGRQEAVISSGGLFLGKSWLTKSLITSLVKR